MASRKIDIQWYKQEADGHQNGKNNADHIKGIRKAVALHPQRSNGTPKAIGQMKAQQDHYKSIAKGIPRILEGVDHQRFKIAGLLSGDHNGLGITKFEIYEMNH